MNNYRIGKTPYWIFYQSDKRIKINNCGKWMYFFKKSEYQFAKDICSKAMNDEIVHACKHTSFEIDSLVNPNSTSLDTGVTCFYLNGKSIESHNKILAFMIDNELIQKTKSGKLFNIGFKYDEQILNNEYGDGFTPKIKLEDFVDLETGSFIRNK